MDSQGIAAVLVLTSIAVLIGLIMLGDSLRPREEKNIEQVQKASSNALTGMILAFFLAQPLAITSAMLGAGLFGWLMTLASILSGFDFLLKWRKYRAIAQQLLLQEAIAKGVEIGMKKAKES
ncbi:hypothetical protein [Thermococcus sp.]|uniref:hypothetical protein n=1 Tax=Thermococcus sp. TaxID=35749 RepID=UPI002616E723|nr:hypothetical protein [Thermococcus sp.]